MLKLGLLGSTMLAAFALAGCQHQDAAPAAAVPPPTVTSAPLPPPGPPPPPGPMGGGWHHPGPPRSEHVYKLDFVFTPKDPKDATLTPTNFTISVADHQTGDVNIGRNVPLTVSAPPPPAGEKPGAPHPGPMVGPRQDVGMKVKAHPQSMDGTTDILIDVELELSTVEGGGAIRKLTSHGAVVGAAGKAATVVSIDDDKRHYDLTVTTTQLR